jgi:hypothetical protein
VANHDKSKRDGEVGAMSIKDKHFAYSLIAQNFIFTAVTMPNVILNAMQMYEQFNEPTSVKAAMVNVMFTFGLWCNYAFESLPFFLNLGFNKIFKSELKEIFLVLSSKLTGKPVVNSSTYNSTKFVRSQTQLNPSVLGTHKRFTLNSVKPVDVFDN